MKKTLLFLFTILVTATISAQTVGDTFVSGDISYTVTSVSPNEAEVSGYSGSNASLSIPATATDASNSQVYSIVAIGKYALASNTVVTTVSLPSSVVTLREEAFGNSALTTINLENVVTIEKKAVVGCPLVSVGTLSSCTSIGDYAFNLCFRTLGVIEFPVLETIGVGSIYDSSNGGTSLVQINLPSSLTSINKLFLGGHQNLNAVQLNWTNPNDVTITTNSASTADGEKSVDHWDFFRWLTKSDITLYVPTGTKTLYQAHALWGQFPADNIVEGELPDLPLSYNVEKELAFNIYPNPTDGVVFIKSKQLDNATVSVYGINGSVLLQKSISGVSSEINLSDLASGIYILQVEVEGGVFTKRIVKK